ncbi:MAG TPA: hypothetical protein VNC78_02505 [Actinomycetota bacterium]|nr:hypothetical protein [Actinomycetota bacterium]
MSTVMDERLAGLLPVPSELQLTGWEWSGALEETAPSQDFSSDEDMVLSTNGLFR